MRPIYCPYVPQSLLQWCSKLKRRTVLFNSRHRKKRRLRTRLRTQLRNLKNPTRSLLARSKGDASLTGQQMTKKKCRTYGNNSAFHKISSVKTEDTTSITTEDINLRKHHGCGAAILWNGEAVGSWLARFYVLARVVTWGHLYDCLPTSA